jgi:response regulator RpfG family c-di-GMP phosphodiesterase
MQEKNSADQIIRFSGVSNLKEWKLLIVDDEDDVHRITRLALTGLRYHGLKIKFLSAYSGEEACRILSENDDIALVLLDVVMETDHAGLDVADYVRNELQNDVVRIVFRTGQPGQAPEDEILDRYDIDDYREKTDLTAQKLRTLARCSFNSFKDKLDLWAITKKIVDINTISQGLVNCETVNEGARYIYSTLYKIISGSNLPEGEENLTGHIFSFVKTSENSVSFIDYITGKSVQTCNLPNPIIEHSVLERCSLFKDNCYTICSYSDFHGIIFYIDVENKTGFKFEKYFADLLQETLSTHYRNKYLNDLINRNQREIMYRICEVVETRSKESGVHVKRVSAYCELLAKLSGMPSKDVELLKKAAPLHDLGKIAIPDQILHKPGKLDDYEWQVMKTHAQIGYEMLKDSEIELFNVAAEVAFYHHEKWNGKGYPNGLAGEAIPIAGRITAIADVFDALASDRCYKKKWPLDKIYNLFKEERGEHFDPHLCDLFIEHFEEFVAIKESLDSGEISSEELICSFGNKNDSRQQTD